MEIKHQTLAHGDRCPECRLGNVYRQKEPKVLVRVTGQAPLAATVYSLERLRCGTCGQVFTAQEPEGVGEDNFRNRVRNPILKQLGIDKKLKAMGIKRCGNYAFRHMNATVMDEIGIPLKTRQHRLGHARIETTMSHYTHKVDADDRGAAEAIGSMLSPAAETTI